MTTQTIQISHSELVQLTRKVFPHVSTDDMLPVLCSMKIESQGKWLLAYATDRFSAGLQRIEKVVTEESPETEWPEFTAVIGGRDLKSLLAHYKPQRRAIAADLSLTVEEEKLRVETISGGFDLFDSAHTTYRLVTGEYPKILPLFQGALHKTTNSTRSVTGLNPLFVGRFALTGRRHEAVEYRIGQTHKDPLVVLDGDGFIGLLMPRRLLGGPDAPAVIEDWTDIFPAPTTDKAATA